MNDDIDNNSSEQQEIMEKLQKWTDAHISLIKEMEADIGMAGVMGLLAKTFVSVAYVNGVSLDKIQLGISLTHEIVADVYNDDNMTQSHNVH